MYFKALNDSLRAFYTPIFENINYRNLSTQYNSTFVCTNNMKYASGVYDSPCIWIPNEYSDFVVSDKTTSNIECLKDGVYDLHFTFGGKFNNAASLHLYVNSSLTETVPVESNTIDGSVQSQDVNDISLQRGDVITIHFYRTSGHYCGVAGLSVMFSKT